MRQAPKRRTSTPPSQGPITIPICMASVFQPMARGRISRGTSIGPSEALAGMVKARPTPNSAATAKMATRLG